MKVKGFSLLELIIWIGIFALFMHFIFPALGLNPTLKTEQRKCVNGIVMRKQDGMWVSSGPSFIEYCHSGDFSTNENH